MVCYCKYGYNEGDDFKFMQFEMYDIINNYLDFWEVYNKWLVECGDVDKELVEEMEDFFWKLLQECLDEVCENLLFYEYQELEQVWWELKKIMMFEDYWELFDIGIDCEVVDKLIKYLIFFLDGFILLSKVKCLMKGKNKLLEENKLDWVMGEFFVYGSIFMEGKDVCMSGQDVCWGIFFYWYVVVYDVKIYEFINCLDGIQEGQGKFCIFNFLLFEFVVLGFEYGYFLVFFDNLVFWEVQFGDFYNGV